jgi:dihydrofolate reductase
MGMCDFSKTPEGVLHFDSPYKALQRLHSSEYDQSIEQVFLIGGASLYSKCLAEDPLLRSYCDGIYFTKVNVSIECDAFFPKHVLEHFFQEVPDRRRHVEENGFVYDLCYYRPLPTEP